MSEAIVGGVGVHGAAICILALGNSLAGDDGVGLAVLDEFVLRGVPEGVAIARASDASALIDLALAYDRVVLVDAAVGDGDAGTVVEVGPDDLAARKVSLVSTHGVSVVDAVAMARAIARSGEIAAIHVVAVVIEKARRFERGFSAAVERAVPIAVERVREFVREPRAPTLTRM